MKDNYKLGTFLIHPRYFGRDAVPVLPGANL